MTLIEVADICHTPFDGGASVEAAKARAKSDADALNADRIYTFAAALKAAAKALADIPYGVRPAFDALADDHLLGDLSDWARDVKALADVWQAEIDGEEG